MKLIRIIKASRTVYHGSPYKFKTFDQSKIGTGDGNKYGWGIYFTSDNSFANSYGRGKEYYNGEPITNVYISLNIPNLLKGKKRSVIKEYKDFKPEVAEFAKNFDPSKYERKKGYVTYLKEAEKISDFLKQKSEKNKSLKNYYLKPKMI